MIRARGHDYTIDDVRACVSYIGEYWRQLTTDRDAGPALDVGSALVSKYADALGEASGGAVVQDELDRLSSIAGKVVTEESAERLIDVGLGGIEAVVEALRAGGQVLSAGSGTVVQVNRSAGGVPKLPVEEAAIGWGGLEGDAQSDRKHHGRPFQALCLWSTEVIDSFVAAGHPLGYGSAGENLTLSGVPWPLMRAGVRLQIGTVLAETSFFAVPCAKNSQWFLDRDHTLMHHSRGPISRIYAWVREPGRIAVGDSVEVV